MPKYTLKYFSAKALGDAPRMLFAYGGQEFEDLTIQYDEWPGSHKADSLYGQLPTLVIDGKLYAQSTAISRYLGRKYGLSGDNLEEDLEIDQVVDFIVDIRARAIQVHYDKDEVSKTRRHEDYTNNVYPDLLATLDEVITKNNGYLALGKLTWADFLFASNFDYLKMMMKQPDLDKKYPNFRKVIDNVEKLPKVKAYLDSAPKREFDF